MTRAFIGLGSNMGDRLDNLSRAVDAVADIPETHVARVSRAYESEPAIHEEQPEFLNAVVELSTALEPEALLAYLFDIEDEMGRVRTVAKGPRVIDLDLLLFGDEERTSPELTIPHPGLLERDFVVTPLLEIEPRITLPDGTHPRRSAATLGLIVRDYGPIPDAGAEHNMPIAPTAWIEVARSEDTVAAQSAFDAGLVLKRDVLEQEGIPFAFEPFEPGAEIDPFGLPITYRLVVPEEYAATAQALLAAVEAAEPEMPE